MPTRQFTSFLARFLDSRAPALFIVGSLVLGLFSNAVYGLILVVLGDSPWTLVGIVVASVVILPLLYLSFRTLVRAFRRPQATTIDEALRVSPHAALVLLVSTNPKAPELDMIHYHLQHATLRHCWLVVSPAVRALNRHEDLRAVLENHNVMTHLLELADARQGQATYQQVQHAVAHAQQLLGPTDSIIVDITGGTKPMTAGAVLACRETATAMQYALPSAPGHTGPSLPMLVTFADREETP